MQIIIIAKPETEIRPSWANNPRKFTDLLLSDKPFKADKLDEELKSITNGEHVKKN